MLNPPAQQKARSAWGKRPSFGVEIAAALDRLLGLRKYTACLSQRFLSGRLLGWHCASPSFTFANFRRRQDEIRMALGISLGEESDRRSTSLYATNLYQMRMDNDTPVESDGRMGPFAGVFLPDSVPVPELWKPLSTLH